MATLARQEISDVAKRRIEKAAKRLGCSQADVLRRLIEAAMKKGEL